MSQARPATLGQSPKLKSLDDVDAALHELGWLAHQTQVIDGKTQTAVAALQQAAAEKLQVEIDGQAVTFADRSQQLREALERWCEASLAQHLPAGASSLTLAHGTVGLRKLAAAVAFTEGADDKSVLAAVEKRTGLAKLLAGIAETVLGALTLGNVIRLSPAIDKTAVKRAWEASPQRQRTLKSLGLQVETDRQAWVIEPAAVEVAAPAALPYSSATRSAPAIAVDGGTPEREKKTVIDRGPPG